MKTAILSLVALCLILAAPVAAQTRYEATIAQGGTVSTAIQLPSGCTPAAIAMPGALSATGGWTAADLIFQASVTNGTIYGPFKDEFKARIAVGVETASDIIRLPIWDWHAIKYIKIEATAAQEEARTVAVICGK